MRRIEMACALGWLPGFSVNMSIGQGDLIVSPLQMAVTYAAIANGGNIVKPHFGAALGVPNNETGEEEIVQEFAPEPLRKLPLDDTQLGVIKQGLEDVVMGDEGTAVYPFSGFPLDQYPIAGKTGTAQIGLIDSDLNYAWFTSYAPADDPQYVVAVYLEQAGHGGESAAPVARQIYEAIFNLDKETDVTLSQDPEG
jgi:penicillin-binding protein 2